MLQRSVGRSCSAVGHRSNAPRPSAQPNIATTPRGLAYCWPSQQRCDIQRVAVAAPEERYKLQCIVGQRRNHAASCNAPGHHCNVARSCSVAPLPAIAAAATELYTSDVGLSSDLHRTSVERPSNFRPSNSRPTFVRHPSNFRPTSGPASLLTSSSCVRPASLLTSSYCRPTYVVVDVTACVIVLTSCAMRDAVLPLDVLRNTILQSCVLRTMVVHLVVLCPAAYLTAFCRSTVL